MNHLYSLDIIRTLLCLLIVAHHVNSSFPSDGWLSSFFRIFGHASVSFFFVISGFVLYLTFASKAQSYFVLVWKRLKHIYPLHLLTLLVCIAIFQIFNISLAGYVGNPFGTFLNILLLHDWIPFHPEIRQAWNGVSWFLSALFFCYLLYPFLFPKLKTLIVLTFTLWVCFSCYFFYDHINGNTNYEFIYFSPVYRLIEFMIGGIACYFLKNLNDSTFFPVLGIFSLVLSILFVAKGIQGGGVGFIITPFFATIVLYLAKIEKAFNRVSSASIPGLNIFLFTSGISFEIYMIHALVLGIIVAANNKFSIMSEIDDFFTFSSTYLSVNSRSSLILSIYLIILIITVLLSLIYKKILLRYKNSFNFNKLQNRLNKG